MTLNEMTLHGWPMPRRMLQETRDDIDRRVKQASQQLKRFQPTQQLVEGKLRPIPSPEGERVALAAVRHTWNSVAQLVTRDELHGWTRVCTNLFHHRSFYDYSMPIRSLIGKLEAETAAAHLDKADGTEAKNQRFRENLDRLRLNKDYERIKVHEQRAWDAHEPPTAETQPELEKPVPEQDTVESRAKARQEFVQPILHAKGWSLNQWASEAGSTYNTVRDYMRGVTKTLRPSTRKQLATQLDISAENLP